MILVRTCNSCEIAQKAGAKKAMCQGWIIDDAGTHYIAPFQRWRQVLPGIIKRDRSRALAVKGAKRICFGYFFRMCVWPITLSVVTTSDDDDHLPLYPGECFGRDRMIIQRDRPHALNAMKRHQGLSDDNNNNNDND